MEEKVEEDRKIKKKKKDDLLLPPAKKRFHSNATNHYAIDDFNDDRWWRCRLCCVWCTVAALEWDAAASRMKGETNKDEEDERGRRETTQRHRAEEDWIGRRFFCCNARRWRAKFEILLTSKQATDWRVEKHHGLMVVAFASLKDDHGYLVSIV